MNRLKSKTVRWAAISRECSVRGNGVVGLWFWSGSTSDGCMRVHGTQNVVWEWVQHGMQYGIGVIQNAV